MRSDPLVLGRRWFQPAVASAILSAGCSNGPGGVSPPTTGEIRVAVSMTGTDFPATFSVFVSGRSVSSPVAAAVVVGGLAPGAYTVTIRLPWNCQVNGENPRAATVVAGQTTALALAVTCVAATGSLRVTTVTTGVDLDSDGYTIRVDGTTAEGKPYQQAWPLAGNETQTLSGVPVGDDRVTLTGVAINCDLAQASQFSLKVSSAATIDVAFTIACVPDTDQLAYVVGSVPGIRHIYVMGVNRRTAGRRLTDNTSSDEDPAWSPDGGRIAFTTDRDGNPEIYVSNADGSNPFRLTNNPAADYQPAWSRDGQRIAFVSERAGDPEIFAMDADGANVVRLTTSSARETEPAWSPSGQIAFTSDRERSLGIYVMNADGSGTARLTTDAGRHAAWSWDGMLAYSAPHCSSFYYGCYPVIVVKSGGQFDNPLGLIPAEWPTWSPDGRKIAFTALDCDFYYIRCTPNVVQAGRLGNTDISTVAGGSSPAWRP